MPFWPINVQSLFLLYVFVRFIWSGLKPLVSSQRCRSRVAGAAVRQNNTQISEGLKQQLYEQKRRPVDDLLFIPHNFFFIAFSAPLSLQSWLSSCILSHYHSFFFQSSVVHCLTPPLLGRILAWSSSAMCQWPAFSAASSSVVLHYGTRNISALQQLCICTKSTFDKKN